MSRSCRRQQVENAMIQHQLVSLKKGLRVHKRGITWRVACEDDQAVFLPVGKPERTSSVVLSLGTAWQAAADDFRQIRAAYSHERIWARSNLSILTPSGMNSETSRLP